ncbi:OmpA family protein [Roseivirga sp.]|uniref:OmpA family protein n=1 Tax=Roseivirga sp. TaxID=1964215 RepID=UPI003B8C5663
MLRITTILLTLLFCGTLSAQTLHSKNKKALASYREARDLFQIGNLRQSEFAVLQAIKKDKSFDEAILLLNRILIKKLDIEESEQILQTYKNALAPEFVNRIRYDQAHFYFSSGLYQEAAEIITKISGDIYGISPDFVSLLDSSIEFSISQMAKKEVIVFEKLPDPLNQFEMQYFPSITAENQLVFIVRENNGRGNENIYQSTMRNAKWTEPESISDNINTDRNEGTASISADGSTLVFSACNLPSNIGSCDLYISYKVGLEWSKPELLSENVNSKDWDSQPSLSRDGKKLFFVSSRKGGLGKLDIWVSEKSIRGWSEAENLGSEVNTKLDDSSPYISIDQRTLFFASRGRVGMGAYDLYVSVLESGKWKTPQNLGYPINNKFDQVGYTFSSDGWAYYSSALPTGKIELNRFKVPADIMSSVNELKYFSGIVLDKKTLEPISSSIKYKESVLVKTDSITGEFKLFLDEEQSDLNVSADGYASSTLQLNELDELTNIQVLLEPLSIGKKFEFGNIYFDFNSTTIKEGSKATLSAVQEFLESNPKVVIEIGGHTDGIGGESENLVLSQERARSVYRYFIEKGVSKENLVFAGYGEDYPLTAGLTPNEQERNRRIEFKIVNILK